MSKLKEAKEKLYCSKILKATEINVSNRTLQRFLKKQKFKYANIKKKIPNKST